MFQWDRCNKQKLHLIQQIIWENRLKFDKGKVTKVSVDGTDFRIYEQDDEPRSWFSHKFNGPAVRYEIGLSIEGGDIVWINGPFRAGRFCDIVIFRSELKGKLELVGERAEADQGYRGEALTVDLPNDGHISLHRKKTIVRARHETVNKRFKQWGCLQNKWRHDIEDHWKAFHAVAIVTQLSIQNGEPLFQLEY